MCSSYRPAQADRLERFGRGRPDFLYGDCYPGRLAPFLGNGAFAGRWQPRVFGMLPHWAKPDLARMTYNARTETVAEKPSFQHAWRGHQFAIVPADAFFEPCYESGSPVRWRIERIDGEPFGLAGIWERRHGVAGEQLSFSMLTICAEDHPFMRRFHAPGKEKRSVVAIEAGDWDAWLQSKGDAEARAFFRPLAPDIFQGVADPVPKAPQRDGAR